MFSIGAIALAIGCSGGTDHDGAVGSGSGSGSSARPVAIADAAPPPIDAAPARSEHAVFSLVDNRHAAHRVVDGELVIDAADLGFARYTRFGVPRLRWKLGQTVDGVRAAVPESLASIEVPLAQDQAAAIRQLVLRVHGDAPVGKAAPQAVNLVVNGRRASAAKATPLAPGWQSIAIPIEPGRLVAGVNQLAVETIGGKAPIAVAWLRLGASQVDPDPRDAATFDAKADAIALAQNASLVWYTTMPDGAHLVADVAAPCKIEVKARASDDSFAGGVLAGAGARVDLSAAAGKVVGLVLTARDCPRATIAHPRVTLHGPAPTTLPKASAPKYVVLWIMDALRADHIPIFTPGARPQIPNLEELAKTSTIFRQYYVHGNESQTSHSSLWTSLYPANHNVRMAGSGGTWQLGKQFALLAGELGKAGYYTEAVTGNGFVNEDGGYARGFKEFRNMMRETGIDNNLIYGKDIVDAALKRLDAHRSEPTYLFLGTIDTHGPWVARKPWIDIYSPGPYHGPFQEYGTAKDLGIHPDSMGCAIIPPKEDIERLRAIYDSAISYIDGQVGRVVAQLKDWGIWDQTLLIITADHGEELFEDLRCGHGGSLRDSLVRVPLLIHDPSRFPGGTIVEEGVEEVDLMPTILGAIGADVPAAAQGRGLAAVAQGDGKGWATPSYVSMYEYAHAMRIGRWKIRVGVTGAPIVEDMVADPEERVDRSGTAPVERVMLTDNLSMFLALRKQWKKASWGVTTNVTAEGAAALDGASLP